jgi:hypothetical protein
MKAAITLPLAFLATCMNSVIAAENGQSAPVAKPAPAQIAAPLVFSPGGGPWKGETPFQGASWSALGPGIEKGVLMLQARAGIGDKFPVQKKEGTVLFEVTLENGTDDHLVLLIHSEDVDQRIKVTRNKATNFTVSGVKYQALFPKLTVAAAKGEKPTTNKATIMLTHRP